jgi:hypothetical protein
MSYAKKSAFKNTVIKNSFSVFEESDNEDGFVKVTNKKVTNKKVEKPPLAPKKSAPATNNSNPPKKSAPPKFEDSFKQLAPVPDRKQQLPTVSYASMLNKPKPVTIKFLKPNEKIPVNVTFKRLNLREINWADVSDDEDDDY